jgi:hypothetical protein
LKNALAALIIWQQLKERANPKPTPKRLKTVFKRYENLCHTLCSDYNNSTPLQQFIL